MFKSGIQAAQAQDSGQEAAEYGIVRLTNQCGLHLRIAARFAKRAQTFASEITVTDHTTGHAVNGKSTFHMLALGAVCGTYLSISAAGHDATTAVKELTEHLALDSA